MEHRKTGTRRKRRYYRPFGGGPGVGKTRLSTEFLAQAVERGFACFTRRCYERDKPHPLMPFVEIIKAVLAQGPSVGWSRSLLTENAAGLAQIAPILRRIFPEMPTSPELPTAQVRMKRSAPMELEPLARSLTHLPALSICAAIKAWAECGRELQITTLEPKNRRSGHFQPRNGTVVFPRPVSRASQLRKVYAGDWDSARLIAEEASAIERPSGFAGIGLSMLIRLAAHSGD